ncbi:hypothetical membrane protein [Thermococcus onnurineus NA1]|uniref:Hypothetical membrane protein n=1 Tax=Thermococcus onnurineus (strain NA1) TaxID=523850 RepID=B6YXL5_THEON|nr:MULTISPECIES: hypothetical protein [Thermococcus]ACJ16828.1 hypothetical membrane protein [Thermococcus onnurineus NA1]NJE46826.1 hypothetical protein [Thermococcus sp. GR7]NJE78323.1 hypothetical protein [Thermococcus sp. GR4]NJF23380.1 hypothetical protein [Thermococcus sp. GR5]
MVRLVYYLSTLLTAVALFWPVIYGNVPALRVLPGNPLVQAIAGLVIFGGLAYLTFEEESPKNNEEGLTAF